MITTITNNVEASRYEIVVDGEAGGYAEYRLGPGTITFTHTVTLAHLRGRGIAARIVEQALQDARAEGRTVIPQCWYVAQYIDDHPEHADLLGG